MKPQLYATAPIPTPEEIFKRWYQVPAVDPNLHRDAIRFAHDTILTALGYERHGAGWAITIAEQPEPWGEGQPVPQEPPKDLEREKFEKWKLNNQEPRGRVCYEDYAWEAWQARGKEAP